MSIQFRVKCVKNGTKPLIDKEVSITFISCNSKFTAITDLKGVAEFTLPGEGRVLVKSGLDYLGMCFVNDGGIMTFSSV